MHCFFSVPAQPYIWEIVSQAISDYEILYDITLILDFFPVSELFAFEIAGPPVFHHPRVGFLSGNGPASMRFFVSLAVTFVRETATALFAVNVAFMPFRLWNWHLETLLDGSGLNLALSYLLLHYLFRHFV
jgi:hypothetical protein